MNWGLFLEPIVLPQLVAIAAMWTLTAVLLRLDFNHPAHRVFALFLAFRGVTMLAALLRDMYSLHPAYADPAAALYWANLLPYFVIPIPFLLVRFASIYPRRRGWFAARGGLYALTSGAVAAELLYFIDHAWWTTPHLITFLGRDTTLYASDGPLASLLGAMWLLIGVLTLVFALDHRRMPDGARRRALLIVLTGFALNIVYEATGSWYALATGPSLATSEVVQWALRLSLVPLLVAVALLAGQSRRLDPTERAPIVRLFLALPLPALSFIALYHLSTPLGFHPVVSVLVTGFWRLTLPFLVTYALLRFQLFDLDLKVKFAVKQGTLAGIFIFILALTTEILEGFVTDDLSTGLGILVAVGLTYLVTPVQRFADRVSDHAMPHARDTPEFRTTRRLEVYQATLERALEDGALTQNELRLLSYLRDELGLSAADVEQLERRVAGEKGLPAFPAPAGTATPSAVPPDPTKTPK